MERNTILMTGFSVSSFRQEELSKNTGLSKEAGINWNFFQSMLMTASRPTAPTPRLGITMPGRS